MTKDALYIISRVATRSDPATQLQVFARTGFEESPPQQLEEEVRTCRQAAEDFAILSMWAIFERQLIKRLEHECLKMKLEDASGFNQGLFEKLLKAIEYWKIGEALDLAKPLVGSELIGQIKQVKQYRDWIAHRNPRKPTPTKTDADTVERLLCQAIQALGRS